MASGRGLIHGNMGAIGSLSPLRSVRKKLFDTKNNVTVKESGKEETQKMQDITPVATKTRAKRKRNLTPETVSEASMGDIDSPLSSKRQRVVPAADTTVIAESIQPEATHAPPLSPITAYAAGLGVDKKQLDVHQLLEAHNVKYEHHLLARREPILSNPTILIPSNIRNSVRYSKDLGSSTARSSNRQHGSTSVSEKGKQTMSAVSRP